MFAISYRTKVYLICHSMTIFTKHFHCLSPCFSSSVTAGFSSSGQKSVNENNDCHQTIEFPCLI
uniref:Uncharacterized protein n=1 Tax=Anguilla anguilla TaxID=7936 RepID=A0A0E9RER2_ANGAN